MARAKDAGDRAMAEVAAQAAEVATLGADDKNLKALRLPVSGSVEGRTEEKGQGFADT
jgi:hypothetical protein